MATAAGWVYVAAILDLYSRRIVGWAVSQQIDSPLVLSALSMALAHRPSWLVLNIQYAN